MTDEHIRDKAKPKDITGYSINARLKPKKEVEQRFKELKRHFEADLGVALNQSEVMKLTLDVAYGAIFKGDS